MVAAFKYDSKVWAAGIVVSRARESNERSYGDEHARRSEEAWRDLDRQLRAVATRRAALDAEEVALPRGDRDPDLAPARHDLDARVPRARDGLRAASSCRERNDYNDLIGEALRCLLVVHGGGATDGGEAPAGSGAKARRAKQSVRAQIATITKCESCGQGWQLAAGRKIALTPTELETAECDSVHIGSLDGKPGRATSTVPPAIRRQVEQRDNYKCTVPWCRSAANIEVHHILQLQHGGGHEPENMTCLCSGHHAAHHRGELLIEGRAPALTFRQRNEVPHVGDRRDPHYADGLLALTTLGFTKSEARRALDAARVHVPAEADLDRLLRAALRELR